MKKKYYMLTYPNLTYYEAIGRISNDTKLTLDEVCKKLKIKDIEK